VTADILLRFSLRKWKEKKVREERKAALETSLNLDFSREAPSLKRVVVETPKARILCVDDEEVILDSFRKILVLDGYSIDTVKTGQEALGLIQSHHYDFVYTDLRMPEMSGEDVAKSVKHLRPDIDVIIITGYATVESAVECMKYGTMDYMQKPFTEDELLDMTGKFVIRRKDRVKKELKPRVHVTHIVGPGAYPTTEFSIPGGVFISDGHCWVRMEENGAVRIGMDDFAKKLIGTVDAVEPPNLGMVIKQGQTLFSAKLGYRTIPFKSPVSGRVSRVNTALRGSGEALEETPYEHNWVCIIDADNLDTELKELKIGKSAVSFFQDELDHIKGYMTTAGDKGDSGSGTTVDGPLHVGELKSLSDKEWGAVVREFFER
jgi:CheY-like chemotaxis protein